MLSWFAAGLRDRALRMTALAVPPPICFCQSHQLWTSQGRGAWQSLAEPGHMETWLFVARVVMEPIPPGCLPRPNEPALRGEFQ